MGVKKGFLFTTDAIIAGIILVSSILIFSNLYIEEKDSSHLTFLTSDVLNILSELKITEINNTYVRELINNSEIQNLNNSVIEQIGEFWALNKTNISVKLIRNITNNLFPSNMGFSFAIENIEVYRREFGTENKLINPSMPGK